MMIVHSWRLPRRKIQVCSAIPLLIPPHVPNKKIQDVNQRIYIKYLGGISRAWSAGPGIVRNVCEVTLLHHQKSFTSHPQKKQENYKINDNLCKKRQDCIEEEMKHCSTSTIKKIWKPISSKINLFLVFQESNLHTSELKCSLLCASCSRSQPKIIGPSEPLLTSDNWNSYSCYLVMGWCCKHHLHLTSLQISHLKFIFSLLLRPFAVGNTNVWAYNSFPHLPGMKLAAQRSFFFQGSCASLCMQDSTEITIDLAQLGCLRCESFCLVVLESGNCEKLQIIERKGIPMGYFIMEVLDSPDKRDHWLNFPSWCWEESPPEAGSWVELLLPGSYDIDYVEFCIICKY
ncbi:hypothetical protein VP01_7g8 [Puccinia sorghi]|uniref:Uncharacterized protein n=1 Tax=Puccinia sorghi TaxID=27349 RepID=A0A0L6UAI2_9BASI|nr:hypothetical protein VP01_7g8 [Puccinia sorghi]